MFALKQLKNNWVSVTGIYLFDLIKMHVDFISGSTYIIIFMMQVSFFYVRINKKRSY